MSDSSSKYLLQLQLFLLLLHKCPEKKNLSIRQNKKANPLFLPEHMEHKSPFKLQTRLSTARKTLLTMPIIKNMIQRLLPIAEQRLGSDPVFSFVLLFFFFFLFHTDVTACDTGSLTRLANRGECFKVWWPTAELLVQRSSTSASSAAISAKLSSVQLRRVDSTSTSCFMQTIKITLSDVLRMQSLRHQKHASV